MNRLRISDCGLRIEKPRRRREGRSARNPQSNGFTLFEVLLSVTILGVGLAMIGELISTGLRASATTRLEAEATLRCESKMSEMASGVQTLASVTTREYGDGSPWKWSASVEAGKLEGFYRVTVTVTLPAEGRIAGAQFTLIKMLRDPAAIRDAEMMAQEQLEVLP